MICIWAIISDVTGGNSAPIGNVMALGFLAGAAGIWLITPREAALEGGVLLTCGFGILLGSVLLLPTAYNTGIQIPIWVIFGACFAGIGAAIMLWPRFKRRRAVAA